MYNTYRPRRTKGSQRAEFVRVNTAGSYVVNVRGAISREQFDESDKLAVEDALFHVNQLRLAIESFKKGEIYANTVRHTGLKRLNYILKFMNKRGKTGLVAAIENLIYLVDNKIFTELEQLKHISAYYHKAYVLESDKFGQIRKGDVFIHTQHGTSLTTLTVADIRHGKLRLKSFAKPLTKFITLEEFESREIMKLWR